MSGDDEADGVSLPANKGGRPRKLADDAATHNSLAGLGRIQCTIEETAAFFGVTKPTMLKFFEDFPDAKAAFESGKGEGKISLRRTQFALAKKNATMAIFLGKNMLGQADKHEHSGPGGGGIPVDVRAMTDDQIKAEIAALAGAARAPAADDAG